MKEKEKFKWDVTTSQIIKDNITGDAFFDPELSYEMTGYIPINDKSGLDFDAYPFVATGLDKLNNGKYYDAPEGSKLYAEFWKEQMKRITEGYKVGKYRITGDHYFFLNFHPLLNVSKVVQSATGRDTTFPDFWVEHYKYSHYLELAERLKRDVSLLKSRGVGMSEFAAACGERPYTAISKSKCMYAAYAESYLLGDGVLQKVWNTLEFLNQETEGGLRRLRLGKNTELHKKAATKNKQNEESGHLSEIIGQVVDNPRKLRGVRLDRLFFEEAGSFKDLGRAWTQAMALVEINGVKFGTRIAWGTGGDEGVNLAGLEGLFNNPKPNNVLPYKNNYNPEGEDVFTGYFIPAFSVVIPLLDKRGYVSPVLGKAYYDTKRKEVEGDQKKYVDYCSEYCYYPEEALQKQGENEFDKMLLAEQYTNIAILKKFNNNKPKRGRLVSAYAADDKTIVNVSFVEDPSGEIIIIEEPVTEGGCVVKNLYTAGVDGIDHGEGDSVVKASGSKFAVAVKKRQYGIDKGDRYVAFYLERPKDVRTAYNNALKLLIYYNCRANLEDTKIGFRTWLRDTVKNEERFLMKRPNYALSSANKKSNTLWGTPGSEKAIRHGLELLEQFIRDNYMTITWLPMLEQLRKFSYEAKGKFDIVMALVYAEIADEDMYGTKIKLERDSVGSNWSKKRVGTYTDEDGNKRWGTQTLEKEKPKFMVDFFVDYQLQ